MVDHVLEMTASGLFWFDWGSSSRGPRLADWALVSPGECSGEAVRSCIDAIFPWIRRSG
jgi:hypothetical protein